MFPLIGKPRHCCTIDHSVISRPADVHNVNSDEFIFLIETRHFLHYTNHQVNLHFTPRWLTCITTTTSVFTAAFKVNPVCWFLSVLFLRLFWIKIFGEEWHKFLPFTEGNSKQWSRTQDDVSEWFPVFTPTGFPTEGFTSYTRALSHIPHTQQIHNTHIEYLLQLLLTSARWQVTLTWSHMACEFPVVVKS